MKCVLFRQSLLSLKIGMLDEQPVSAFTKHAIKNLGGCRTTVEALLFLNKLLARRIILEDIFVKSILLSSSQTIVLHLD